jgi:hypothetical protein
MTIGEDRVRIKFNPSASPVVDQIKQKTAELIDICETLKLAAQQAGAQSEVIRLCATAQTNYEGACHWAVKAATAETE